MEKHNQNKIFTYMYVYFIVKSNTKRLFFMGLFCSYLGTRCTQ